MELLEIKNIKKVFQKNLALNDVSFSIPKGSIFGLLGPNGAGKTTLIRIITQILGPDSGEIYFNGIPLKQEKINSIGYMPEEKGLYKKMKVGEQLLYLAQLKGMSSKDAKTQIRFWLEKLDIVSWYNKTLDELSKGMHQKVQFISTVISQPITNIRRTIFWPGSNKCEFIKARDFGVESKRDNYYFFYPSNGRCR